MDLVNYYFDLIKYCEDKNNFDEGLFKSKHDFYSSYYKKMTVEMQGEISERINERLSKIQ